MAIGAERNRTLGLEWFQSVQKRSRMDRLIPSTGQITKSQEIEWEAQVYQD
jgi:hypothetical protein